MGLSPTDEQQQIIDAFEDELDIVIEAGAGTGKSSTLKMLGQARPDAHGLYLAFNRKVADEARTSFPYNMECRTAHSIAFRAVGRNFDHRLGGPRVTSKAVADHLGIRAWFKTTGKRRDISSWRIASLAVQTVRRFCHSRDEQPELRHVPFVVGVENMDELRSMVLPYARKVWADVCSQDGLMAFEHDHYLKMWALGHPRLACDFLCLDEAQDTNPVLAQIVEEQEGTQRVLVGDSRQQLFEWRGARDIMGTFEADERLYLTQSFRFGPAIAEEANRWLEYLDAPLRLRGLESIDSKIEQIELPKAILCRTNADVIDQALRAQDEGVDVAIVGGTNEIVAFAEAANQIRTQGKTSHPELSVFSSWQDVMTYVSEEQPDGNFGTFMRLIDRYGTDKVISIANNCVPEKAAERLVSTVHKVKGLEWDTVAVDGNVAPDEENVDDEPRADFMIAYVAVTRARYVLDTTAVDGYHRRREMRKHFAEKMAATSSLLSPSAG